MRESRTIAAYCCVSTDKEDQLNSLEAPKAFFSEYTQRAAIVIKNKKRSAAAGYGTGRAEAELK